MTFASTTFFKGFGEDYLTRSMLACAFISVAIFIVLLGPFLVEDRVLDGHNVWLKPQKFAVSLFIHFKLYIYSILNIFHTLTKH